MYHKFAVRLVRGIMAGGISSFECFTARHLMQLISMGFHGCQPACLWAQLTHGALTCCLNAHGLRFGIGLWRCGVEWLPFKKMPATLGKIDATKCHVWSRNFPRLTSGVQREIDDHCLQAVHKQPRQSHFNHHPKMVSGQSELGHLARLSARPSPLFCFVPPR